MFRCVVGGASPFFVIPVSYLLFGLMWTVSCFLKSATDCALFQEQL